ncbi:hypothetical protein BCR36DRAFT_295325 [Piromyces finnis]|uniref:Extracellular metalloproteinase n=1 Tax=Piromyces finnis TaxID=1754191 RepID=A0A1Y1V6G9_9FUNG|nr:hypothetical protein BCR36DRAFT_295325 [Piromyces finnis]|eukprot:ORX47669.1 hypothetical protein BCR36DRAFT_295325 [Piromyces finnis]
MNFSLFYSFYISNLLHDAFYMLGFNEDNGNLQKYNFNKGGEEDDRLMIIINHKYCNEEAMIWTTTFDDGFIPYIFICPIRKENGKKVFIDGVISSGALTHEYSHIVLSRLVNGSKSTTWDIYNIKGNGMEGCLNEGLSDFFAEAFHVNKEMDRNTPFVISKIAKRKYPISSDHNINPLLYSSYNPEKGNLENYRHEYGEIWATVLHEVLWNIIDFYPSNYTFWDAVYKDIDEPPVYILLLKGIINAIKDFTGLGLTTFLEARDKIIKYCEVEFQDETFICLIKEGFARRSFGFGGLASTVDNPLSSKYKSYDDFEIPLNCKTILKEANFKFEK